MTEGERTISKRCDFVLLFDVQDGNPNGDPDAGNLPRTDPETGHGLVTDVALKRKVRNYVITAQSGVAGYEVFVKEKSVLNQAVSVAFSDLKIDLASNEDSEGRRRKTQGRSQGRETDRAREYMCRRYFDIRTFGAVLSTGANAGQVRGPVQLTFARSIDPILTLEHSITRVAVATEKEAEDQGGDNRTMGRKSTVPYALYRAHGFVSPALAEIKEGRVAQGTGFSDKDLAILWNGLVSMFEYDRSAARGFMSTRALVVFEHRSALGSVPAHQLFDRVRVSRKNTPARTYADYAVTLDAKILDPLHILVRVPVDASIGA